ncbi:MAG: hypothetical protein JXM70_03430 [Pirellulales bacterium]|nr:hypothetical protein [Pirellulales bacterium]
MQAGFNTVDVTPPVGSQLNGFIARLSSSTDVDAPLMVRALYLENEQTSLLIVGLDVLGIVPEFADRMVDDLSLHMGISKDSVLLASSHTHSGPMTVPLRGLGPADDEYLVVLAEKIRQAAIAARDDKHAVTLSWGTAPLSIAVNRRQVMPDDGRVVLGDNPDGPCETDVRVLQLAGEDRTILLFHYACHPYFLRADSSLISSDYYGHAAAALERQGYDCIYLNGCSGDIGPPADRDGPEAARRAGQELAEAVLVACGNASVDENRILQIASSHFGLPHDALDDMHKIENDLAKADCTVRPQESGEPVVQSRLKTAWHEWFDKLQQAARRPNGLEPLPARISIVRIGGGTVVALPGEVFYDLGRRVAAEISGEPLCVAAYCHGYIGYVPDAESLVAGGYESEESHRYVGLWQVSPQAEEILKEYVNGLWKSMGAKSI